MGYFASLLHPQEENLGYYLQSGTCLRALETHVLLGYMWSIFFKWPVINVTLLTLQITVNKIQYLEDILQYNQCNYFSFNLVINFNCRHL